VRGRLQFRAARRKTPPAVSSAAQSQTTEMLLVNARYYRSDLPMGHQIISFYAQIDNSVPGSSLCSCGSVVGILELMLFTLLQMSIELMPDTYLYGLTSLSSQHVQVKQHDCESARPRKELELCRHLGVDRNAGPMPKPKLSNCQPQDRHQQRF